MCTKKIAVKFNPIQNPPNSLTKVQSNFRLKVFFACLTLQTSAVTGILSSNDCVSRPNLTVNLKEAAVSEPANSSDLRFANVNTKTSPLTDLCKAKKCK